MLYEESVRANVGGRQSSTKGPSELGNPVRPNVVGGIPTRLEWGVASVESQEALSGYTGVE